MNLHNTIIIGRVLIYFLLILNTTTICYSQILDTIYSTKQLDGDIYYYYDFDLYIVNITDQSVQVGDGWYPFQLENYFSRGYVSFDLNQLSDLLDSDNIIDVKLFVYQTISIGNGFWNTFPTFFSEPPGSIPCIIDHIVYGDSLGWEDFTAGDSADSQTLSSNIGIISSTPDTGWRSLDVTSQVIEDIVAGRTTSQFRLRFSIDHDDDQESDRLVFLTADAMPWLTKGPYIFIQYDTSMTIYDKSQLNIINKLKLHQNYPNPFNISTSFRFVISTPGKIHLRIIDIKGRIIYETSRIYTQPGEYELTWKGQDMNSLDVPSGIYFATIMKDNHSSTIKVCMVK